MIFDTLAQFASALACPTALGRSLAGDVMDLGAPPTGSTYRDLGAADPLFLVIVCTTTFTSAGGATVSFELSSDTQAAIRTDGVTEKIHVATPAYALSQLVAGSLLFVTQLPRDGTNPYSRYLGIVANVGTAVLTAGAFSAFLTTNPSLYKAYNAADGR